MIDVEIKVIMDRIKSTCEHKQEKGTCKLIKLFHQPCADSQLCKDALIEALTDYEPFTDNDDIQAEHRIEQASDAILNLELQGTMNKYPGMTWQQGVTHALDFVLKRMTYKELIDWAE